MTKGHRFLFVDKKREAILGYVIAGIRWYRYMVSEVGNQILEASCGFKVDSSRQFVCLEFWIPGNLVVVFRNGSSFAAVPFNSFNCVAHIFVIINEQCCIPSNVFCQA